MTSDLPGRNEPCYCGSGRKFKKCHWPQVMERLAGEAKEEMARRRAEESDKPSLSDIRLPPSMAVSRKPPSEMLRRRIPDIRDPELLARVREVEDVLRERQIPMDDASDRKELAEDFVEACRKRWEAMTVDDEDLEDARFRISDIDVEDYEHENGQEAYEERRQAHAADLDLLVRAGGAGVAHLGILLMEDSWSNVLAVETLIRMPDGELRDRAVVEALFCPGDWAPDVAARTVEKWEASRAFQALMGVADRAAEDGVELANSYWQSLFDRHEPPDNEECRFTDEFGPAVGRLYELGHHAAIGRVFQFRLDPMWDGEEDVRAFLDSPPVQDALERLRRAAPVEPLSWQNPEAVETPA